MKVRNELRNFRSEISFAIPSYSIQNEKKNEERNERMRDKGLKQKKKKRMKILSLWVHLSGFDSYFWNVYMLVVESV